MLKVFRSLILFQNQKRVKNPANGIKLDVFSDQNGVQFYTGNFLDVRKQSNGQTYKRHEGFCLEVHNYPDSVNHVIC